MLNSFGIMHNLIINDTDTWRLILSTAKGHIRMQQNVLWPQVKFWFIVYISLEKFGITRSWMNLEGRNQAGRSPNSRAGEAIFWPTPEVKRRNLWLTWAPIGGNLNFCICSTPPLGIVHEHNVWSWLSCLKWHHSTSFFWINNCLFLPLSSTSVESPSL